MSTNSILLDFIDLIKKNNCDETLRNINFNFLDKYKQKNRKTEFLIFMMLKCDNTLFSLRLFIGNNDASRPRSASITTWACNFSSLNFFCDGFYL